MDTERRAQHAQQLLDDELLKECFALVESDLILQWRNSRVTSHVSREKFYQQLRGLEAVRAKLQSAIMDGKIAKANR